MSYWFQCCQSWWDAANCVEPLNSLVSEQHSTQTPVWQIFSEWQIEEMSEIVTFGKYWALAASLFHHLVLQAWIIPQILQLLFKEFCLEDDKTKKSSWKCKLNCRIKKWKRITIKELYRDITLYLYNMKGHRIWPNLNASNTAIEIWSLHVSLYEWATQFCLWEVCYNIVHLLNQSNNSINIPLYLLCWDIAVF